jgi:hypothetical protein
MKGRALAGRRASRKWSEPDIPTRIGSVVFERLERWVTIRCPPEFSPLMRRAGGIWETDRQRWLIHVRRIDFVIRVLRRVTDSLFRQASIDLDNYDLWAGTKRLHRDEQGRHKGGIDRRASSAWDG